MLHQVDIHLVRFPGAGGERLPFLGGRGVATRPAAGIIPADRPLVADDLAGTAISALHVVQMNLADAAVREAKQDGRRVLRVEFEPAQFAAETGDGSNLAHQPPDVVDFMNGIEDHSAP